MSNPNSYLHALRQGAHGWVVALAATACANSADVASNTPQANATPTAASAGADLPDLTKEFESGQCEEIQGSAVPGADSYFHGRFDMRGDTINGNETWWLHANKAWTDREGNDCELRWQVMGTKVPTGACTDCDFGVKLSATPETGASKCPEMLLKREARASELTYDIKLAASGEAFVYFAKSGKLLGQGYHKDGVLVYRTQHQCKWF